jgi:type I restriction enzyme, R subunit
MQAIARANRVNDGKNNGLIVDYGGILKSLRKALATSPGKAARAQGPEKLILSVQRKNCWTIFVRR